MNYLMMNQDKDKEIFNCYEGSLLSLFHFNNNWYFSSRRNLLKVTDETENPHFKMFCDVIKQDGFNINTFIDKLEMNLTYHFVLIHHQNKNIINYEKIW